MEDKKDIIRKIDEEIDYYGATDIGGKKNPLISTLIRAKIYILKSETVIHGRWVDDGALCYCSECHEEKRFPHWTSCPNCGAKMDGNNSMQVNCPWPYQKKDLTEFYKLRQYLINNEIDFVEQHKFAKFDGQHITNFDWNKLEVRKNDVYVWDAVCHGGSYGSEQGLLEISGSIVLEEDGDSVKGFLTAEDVINRFERMLKR